MHDNAITYHNCTPAMADVVSGAIPRPAECTNLENVHDWLLKTPACRKLKLQHAGLVAAYNLPARTHLTPLVNQLREYAGYPGSVWILDDRYICINLDGTHATTYDAPAWTIAKIKLHNRTDPAQMFAALTADRHRAYSLGEIDELISLRNTLNTFLRNDARTTETIDELAEEFGTKWLSASQAAAKYDIPVQAMRGWMADSPHAEQRADDWHAPDIVVRGWVATNQTATYRTPSELSTRYRVPQNTIRSWLAEGKIDGARKTEGGGWIVPERNFVLSPPYQRWTKRNPPQEEPPQ